MAGMNSSDTATVIVILAVMIFVLAYRMIGNRRAVTRHVLHGQVTYTIKGFDGPDTRKIVHEIHGCEPEAEIQPDELEHRAEVKRL